MRVGIERNEVLARRLLVEMDRKRLAACLASGRAVGRASVDEPLMPAGKQAVERSPVRALPVRSHPRRFPNRARRRIGQNEFVARVSASVDRLREFLHRILFLEHVIAEFTLLRPPRISPRRINRHPGMRVETVGVFLFWITADELHGVVPIAFGVGTLQACVLGVATKMNRASLRGHEQITLDVGHAADAIGITTEDRVGILPTALRVKLQLRLLHRKRFTRFLAGFDELALAVVRLPHRQHEFRVIRALFRPMPPRRGDDGVFVEECSGLSNLACLEDGFNSLGNGLAGYFHGFVGRHVRAAVSIQINARSVAVFRPLPAAVCRCDT